MVTASQGRSFGAGDKTSGRAGFTLVELMVVVAIMGILAAVAVPHYFNYVNQSHQSEPVWRLMNAKMDQEIFWEENNRYAGTIGCLASFGNDCGITAYSTQNGYEITITSAGTTSYTIEAKKKVYDYAPTDIIRLEVTAETPDALPDVVNPEAIEFSVFKWILE
ncbi:type IV pilin protein [Desulfoglaeba alkanexedens]|jgi:type IV pilus assembly protein PilE|nr:type IV pilin protein [Desulfoglaeba alkanexedens]